MKRRTVGIGFVIILSILILGGPIIQQVAIMANTQVLYQSPENGENVQSGVWLCKEFAIPETHFDYFVAVEGIMLSHSYIEDQFEIEFGFGICTISKFLALNETEKLDIIDTHVGGAGWDESGTSFTSGYTGVNQVGTHIWAVRFIDLYHNTTQFKVDIIVTLRSE
ncbi:MAG: hypothetical protein RTU30_08610 [Candidatus Thorarchaeota archaeon]